LLSFLSDTNRQYLTITFIEGQDLLVVRHLAVHLGVHLLVCHAVDCQGSEVIAESEF
jgi:hypothetical protein